LESEK
jgi:hypothetical protein